MNEALTADGQVRTYRGSSIEELLPRLRAELGPEAVIVRQREGLVGGVGGFFQKRCVEVEARPGGPRVDVYDEDAYDDRDEAAGPWADLDDDANGVGPRVLSQGEGGAAGEGVLDPPPPVPPAARAALADGSLVRNDGATREGLATPSVRKLVGQAQPFAEMLDGLGADAGGEPPLEAEPAAPASEDRPEPRRAGILRGGLVASGLGEDLVAEIVDAVVASSLPFANAGRLRTLIRDELALRLPVAPAAAPGRRSLAVVGPAGAGKSAALAGIAAAHAATGTAVACVAIDARDDGGALTAMLDGSDVPVFSSIAELAERDAGAGAGLILIDTPAAWSGCEGLKALAAALAKAAPDEVHLALRAGTAASAAAELLAGLEALRPNRLLLTGGGETAHLGGALDLAIRAELPLAYVAEGAGSIAPAEARALASRVTP